MEKIRKSRKGILKIATNNQKNTLRLLPSSAASTSSSSFSTGRLVAFLFRARDMGSGEDSGISGDSVCKKES
jgi:hypothetical protein